MTTSKMPKTRDGKRERPERISNGATGSRGRASTSQAARAYKFKNEELDAVATAVAKYPGTEATGKLKEQDMHECVSEVMRHMLAQNNKRPHVPVAYDSIQKLLQTLQPKLRAIAGIVIKAAQHEFVKLGFEMMEIASKTGGKSHYVLQSVLPDSFLNEYIHSDQEKAMSGLKLVIQMYLHLKGDKASEEDLLGFLENLGIHLPRVAEQVSSRHDPGSELQQAQEAFGHLNPLAALQQQQFIQVTKETGSEGFEELLIKLGSAVSGPASEPAQIADVLQEVIGS
eukprot:TRINITY_DN80968_c0_g1_i1.p1 TRINITY_DN80968_c0_g1~~TRINITY_DN80968_c0_g1_i1.p1  ORF type:complete len:284 (-),score=38.31 TRINITY_DN80968_c0_g1_i1:235-1086(-)